jgi:multidrug efflux pump subunit AcrB
MLIGADGARVPCVPAGFIPTQDKQYLFAGAQLPEGASLDRTEAGVRSR